MSWGMVGSGAASGAATGAAAGPWGAIIGGVIGAAGAYFGGKAAADAAKRLTPEQRQLFDLITKNVKSASEFGNFVMNLSKDPIIGGTNFIQSMAHGDRSILARYANLDELGAGARRSLQTMSQIAPRSGASAEYLSSLPQQVAQAGQAQVQDLRKTGESNLLGAGESLANLGSSVAGGANAAAAGQLGFLQNKQQYGGAVGADTAGSLYSIFQNMLGYTAPNGSRVPGATDAISNWWKNRGTGGGSVTNPGAFFGGGSIPGLGGTLPSGGAGGGVW